MLVALVLAPSEPEQGPQKAEINGLQLDLEYAAAWTRAWTSAIQMSPPVAAATGDISTPFGKVCPVNGFRARVNSSVELLGAHGEIITGTDTPGDRSVAARALSKLGSSRGVMISNKP